ncbi:hypothetical protein [Spirosoma sordidisoli]|uniref:Peptidase S24/S26A/S26B/S26C domain-containing protein n=1 Tax=Spirosoma sordidisoli TaxID=2502893 RepID=A0A4Q2UMJ7_9BACT|nr:hypothetical protein [Spirosoma sordidisoli]RYC70857.1 hypothetical protein EQG79_01515 [Spirosoma sordidisoli]
MSTEQKYVGKGDNAPSIPQTAPSAAQWPKPTWHALYLAQLVADGSLSEDDRNWSEIIPIPDESMQAGGPLNFGGSVVSLMLDPTEYHSTTGVVLIQLRATPATYIIGRVRSANKVGMVISRDNPAWPTRAIRYGEVVNMYKGLFVTNAPVL